MNIAYSVFEEWHDAIANAYKCLHTEDFPAALIEALGKLVRTEAVMITMEYKDSPPELLYDQGVPDEKRELIINRYFSIGYLLDPFSLMVTQGLKQGFILLSEIAPDDFYKSAYYETYYSDTGSVEECYFVADIGDKAKISICLYHGHPSYRYSQQELLQLRAVEPLIRELLLSHWAKNVRENHSSTGSSEKNSLDLLDAAFANFCGELLTEREVDVTRLILRGHSSKSAARVLDISPETVRDHRKNLYRKLAVNSQSQLFALFIDSLSNFNLS